MRRGRSLGARPTATAARSSAAAEELVQAAAQVFARDGYEGASTGRIAERAGVTVAAVHEVFVDKDAILVAVIEQHLEDAFEAFQPLLTDLVVQSPPIADGVHRMLRALVGLHRTHPALHRVLFEEAPRPVVLRHRLERTVEAAVEAVTGYLGARPEVRVADVRVAAQLAVQVAENVAHSLVITPKDGVDPDAYIRETERMLVGYLTGR